MAQDYNAGLLITLLFILLLVFIVFTGLHKPDVEPENSDRVENCMFYFQNDNASFVFNSSYDENCKNMLNVCPNMNGTLYNLTNGKADRNKYIIHECYIGPNIEELQAREKTNILLTTITDFNNSCISVGNKLIIENLPDNRIKVICSVEE